MGSLLDKAQKQLDEEKGIVNIQSYVDAGIFPGPRTGEAIRRPYGLPTRKESLLEKAQKRIEEDSTSLYERARKEVEADPGILEGFSEGFGDDSSSAILAGGGVTVEERDLRSRRKLSFSTRLSKSFGEILGSIPVFAVGGKGGGLAGGATGGAIGSVVPVVGTVAGAAIGTTLGAGAGAFALDVGIKTAYHEYLDLIEKDPRFKDASFLEVVQNIDKSPILIETVKAGGLGALVALNPMIRFMPVTPVTSAIMKGTPGKFMRFGSEVSTLTAGGAALEGKMPTAEDLAHNVLLIGGVKIAHSTANKMIRGAKNTGNFGIFRELDAFSKKDLKRIEEARTDKEVNKIINEVNARQAQADVNPAHIKTAKENVNSNLLYSQAKSSATTSLRSKAKKPSLAELRKSKSQAITDLKEVKTKNPILEVPFSKLKVRLSDLKIAERDLKKGKPSVTPDAPIEVTINLTKRTNELSDGYHRYLEARGGTIGKAVKSDANQKIKAEIKFVKDIRFGKFTEEIPATESDIKTAYEAAKKSGNHSLLIKAYTISRSKIPLKPEPSLKDSIETIDGLVERQDNKSLPQRVAENISKDFSVTKLQRSALDDIYPVKDFMAQSLGINTKMVEVANIPLNVYRSLRVAKGSTRMAQWAIEENQFSFNDRTKNVGPGFTKIIERFKSIEEVNELMNYKIAKRNVEKSKQGFNTGIPLAESKVISKAFASKYEEASRALAKFSRNNLTMLEEAGLLNEKSKADIEAMNKEFVSYSRVFAEPKEATRLGKFVEQGIKKFKGVDPKKPTPKILDPVESYISNTYQTIETAVKNKAAQDLVKFSRLTPIGRRMVQEVPRSLSKTKADKKEIISKIEKEAKERGEILDPKVLELLKKSSPDTFEIFRTNAFTPEPNTIRVWWDGKPKLYKLASKELYESIVQATSPREFSFITKYFLAPPASTLRAGAILDTRFLIKNPIRDYFGALVFSKYNMSPLAPFRMLAYNALNQYGGPGKEYIHSFKGVKKFNELYADFIKSGGGLSTMQSVDAITMKEQLSNVKNMKKFTVLQALRKAGELTEEAARLSEFEAAVKVEGNTALGREIAAFASRDLSIDFAKAGVLGREMNKIVPFFNAQLQGTEKFYREMTRNQASSDRLVYTLTKNLIVPSMVMALLAVGDKEIEELQEQERDFNWIYRNPVTGKLNKAPVPFEPGIVTNGFTRRWVDFVVKKDPKAFDGFLSSLFNSTIPGFVPQAILPILETVTNYNSFRGVPIIPGHLQGLLSQEQYTNYTTDSAKSLSKIMLFMAKYYDIATFDEKKGAQKIVMSSKFSSPMVIDHFVSSWTGGLGKQFTKTADEALIKAGIGSQLTRPTEGVLERLGLNPFSVRFPRASTKSINTFYDNYFFMKGLQNSANKMALEGRVEEATQLLEEFDFIKLDKRKQAMNKMQAGINAIWLNPEMTADEKRHDIDGLYLNMIIFAQETNKRFEEEQKKMRKKRKNK